MKVQKFVSNARAKGAVLFMSAVPLLAAAQTAATPEDSIGEGITKILAIVAIGGAGYLTISLAGVGWNVGSKFIKRLGGKA